MRANLASADLSGVNLRKVNFQESKLHGKVKNLTPELVKSACNRQQAKFDEEFQKALANEPDQEVNCSLWE